MASLCSYPIIGGTIGLRSYWVGYPWYCQPAVTRLYALRPASVARPACAVTWLSVARPAYEVTGLSMVQLAGAVTGGYPQYGPPALLSRYLQLSAVRLVCAVTPLSAVTSLLWEWRACAVHLLLLFLSPPPAGERSSCGNARPEPAQTCLTAGNRFLLGCWPPTLPGSFIWGLGIEIKLSYLFGKDFTN